MAEEPQVGFVPGGEQQRDLEAPESKDFNSKYLGIIF